MLAKKKCILNTEKNCTLEYFIVFKVKDIKYNIVLDLKTFKQILLTLVPENPTIPTDVCEELIVLVLSIYHENVINMKKAQCILYWLLCKLHNLLCYLLLLPLQLLSFYLHLSFS